jgi:hypothetical protein
VNRRAGQAALQLCVSVGAILAALLAMTGPVDAAPLPGGTHFNIVQSANPFVQVIAPACPIFGGAHPENSGPDGANISIHLNGWAAPYLDTPFLAFSSTAEVHGTLVDAEGDVNTVTGNFTEGSVRADIGDPFIGTGRLTIAGPHGTVVGDATLADLSAPPEIDLTFTTIAVCSTR